jgi:hypothetical protein
MQQTTYISYKIKGENLFLTIQLLQKFDFGHQTSKTGVFSHPTIKTIQK